MLRAQVMGAVIGGVAASRGLPHCGAPRLLGSPTVDFPLRATPGGRVLVAAGTLVELPGAR